MTLTKLPVLLHGQEDTISSAGHTVAKLFAENLQPRFTPIWLGLLLLLLGSSIAPPFLASDAQAASVGAPISVNTASDFDKSNQSKVFYHDGKWWVLALLDGDTDWYIWKYDAGTNTWTNTLLITTSSSRIPDVVLDASGNRLFVHLSHDSKPDFMRLTYNSGAWSIDSGFPLRLEDFIDDDVNRVSLVRAKNGDLWLFRIAGNILQAKHSTNSGTSWSSVINLKSGLNNAGVTDAVTFTAPSGNHLGVAYGETDIAGSRFGFLVHKDTDAENVWIDETSNLTLGGSVRATNELCVTVDAANNVFLLTQNLGATGSEARNSLFKRSASGTWQAFSVNTSASWKSPAIAVHPGNGALHVMGINATTGQGEYKSCAVGSESNLATTAASVLFTNGSGADAFANLSVPAFSNFGAATILMVCVDNTVTQDIWFNELSAGGPPPPPDAVTVGNVVLSNSQVLANASYTIPITLGSSGALASGSGTIAVKFPSNTVVPGSMALNQVKVNGNNAANVVTNTLTREVTITTPINLANDAAVSVFFATGAGLLNPSTAGNYTLQARTSAQTTPGTSPNYNISVSLAAVTVGNITLLDNHAGSNSRYTIPLTLGNGGALASGSGTITVQFPANTIVPGSIAASQVKVNGTSAANVSTNSGAREIVITTPIALAENASVNVVINATAGLVNPTTPGNYTLQVHTSAQPTPGVSPIYVIAPAMTQVSAATVIPNPALVGSAAAYTILFNLGSNGHLTSGSSTIIITFNNATGVADGSLSGALVNGVNASASGNSGSKTTTLTVPASLQLNDNASVTVDLPSGITNPNSASSYTLMVATSAETTPVTSNSYDITNSPPPPPPDASGEDLPITGSIGGYDKPNQNRPFFHDGHWWTAARRSSDGNWCLWKLTGTDWSAQVALDDRASTRPDCYIEAATNKLYILLASTSGSGSKFTRLTYSSGSFSTDSGFPVTLSDFTFTGEYCMVLTKAKNGDLWIFRYRNSQVDAQRSSNGGTSWSSTFTVKSSIATTGLVDAVTFSSGGSNYVGVAFGENTDSGSIYGFLKHKDGDANDTWSDETGSLPALNNADSDDHISLAVSPSNEIYFIVKTHPGGGSSPGIALFKRASGGSWSAFTIQTGGGWTRPAVVVDETHSEVYVMGTQESSPEKAQYKKCTIGNESSLASASAIDLMDKGGYNNISVPRHPVNSSTNLLACAEDQGSGVIYYVHFPLGGGGGGPTPTPLVVNTVSVNPNTENLAAAYTINMTLGSVGGLTGSSGTITITWPNGTTVPGSMANSTVTVNGSNANGVTTNSVSRTATVTVPNNLSNNASVTLAFLTNAGLTNPSAGNYTLQAKTSAQTSNVTSPSYAIAVAAPPPSALAVNGVSVTPDTVTRAAQYTINLTLGSNGALNGNSGTITVTWPNNTTVPVSIANAAVSVNGASAANVLTNSANRQASVTIPSTLANSASVTLIFSSAAGLVNPTTAGSYTLQVQTSAEPGNVTSPSYALKELPAPPPPPNDVAGGIMVAKTDANLDRSGQGKLFYFQNAWWLIAYDSVATDWYLWKFANGSWSRNARIEPRPKVRIDAVLDSANNKLYYVASHTQKTRVGRLAYSGGTWVREANVNVANFGHGNNANAVKLARAKNGELWVFRMNVNVVEAKISTDNGATWSAVIAIKSGLLGTNGMVDGLTFTTSGVNRIGIIYGMTSANGGSQYGFLHHQDGAALNTWVDESSNLTFFGNERGENWFNAQVTPQGVIYILTRNSNATGPNAVWNSLYKRAADGSWQKFKVNVNARWNYPVVGLDASNQRVYVFGVRHESPNFGEYKFCAFGNETSLEAQSPTAVLRKGTHVFQELAGPMRPVYANMGMMICGGNATANHVWYNLFIPPVPKIAESNGAEDTDIFNDATPEISAYPNPFNPATTIRFKVRESARVRLRIFDIRGALVRSLFDREVAAGIYEARWNGKDRDGFTVASGLYFYRLEINDRILRGSLQMVK